MPEATPNPEGQGQAAAGQQQNPAGGQPSKYEQLAAKKGYKTPDDLASSYEALEPELGKSKNAIDKAKKQLESAGYTLDEDGTIRPKEQQNGYQAPGNGYQAPGYQAPGQGQNPQETVYDPYTGQALTDPMALQLARMPVGQREAFLFNVMQDQRDRQQNESYAADSEILSKPEAKGFEDDVRKAMMNKPLAQRASKQVWQDTLLQVKGARYDTDRTAWQKNGVDDFLNKEGQQGFQGSGQGSSANDGSRLSPEQEQQYQWYAKNRAGQFKDRKHFLSATSPNYGR